MEEEVFNKQRGVQYEPQHGFTVHFIVCIYISTILNKHLSASILKDETHTSQHISMESTDAER